MKTDNFNSSRNRYFDRFDRLDISVGAEALAASRPHSLCPTDVEKLQSLLSFRYRNNFFLLALT